MAGLRPGGVQPASAPKTRPASVTSCCSWCTRSNTAGTQAGLSRRYTSFVHRSSNPRPWARTRWVRSDRASPTKPCREIIESFGTADFKRREIYTQGEMGTQGGMASIIGSTLTGILKDIQPRGVSAHLHYCWVYRSQTIIKTNNHAQKGRWTISGLGRASTTRKTTRTNRRSSRRWMTALNTSACRGWQRPGMNRCTYSTNAGATHWAALPECCQSALVGLAR